MGRGLALLTNKEKNYVNEYRVSSLAWEMPFTGNQSPPNYYYDNCLAGVTSSLLVQACLCRRHGAPRQQPLRKDAHWNYYYYYYDDDNECASEWLGLSEKFRGTHFWPTGAVGCVSGVSSYYRTAGSTEQPQRHLWEDVSLGNH